MTKLRDELRTADPVAREGGLTAPDASRLRRTVLSEAPVSPPVVWNVFAMAAVVLVATVVSAAWLVRNQRPDVAAPIAARVGTPHVAPAGGERRQLLLETPGGTRIIWTFNESFQLR